MDGTNALLRVWSPMTEREELIREHQTLAGKIFDGGLHPIEKLRLVAVRRRLDELDPLNAILDEAEISGTKSPRDEEPTATFETEK